MVSPGLRISITVDTELGSSAAGLVEDNPLGYNLAVQAANEGGSQYLGLTITGSTDVSQIRAIALRGKTRKGYVAMNIDLATSTLAFGDIDGFP